MKRREEFTALMIELLDIFEKKYLNQIFRVRCKDDIKEYLKFKNSLVNFYDAVKTVLERITNRGKKLDNNFSTPAFYTGWHKDFLWYIEKERIIKSYVFGEFYDFVNTINILQLVKKIPYKK